MAGTIWPSDWSACPAPPRPCRTSPPPRPKPRKNSCAAWSTLNAERAAEEARGRIRWLRPDYQNPSAQSAPEQTAADLDTPEGASAGPTAKVKKRVWPKGMREQIAAVRDTLGNQSMTLDELSARFKEPAKTTPLIVEALAALEELGMVERANDQYRMAG